MPGAGALRVLGVAERPLDPDPDQRADALQHLVEQRVSATAASSWWTRTSAVTEAGKSKRLARIVVRWSVSRRTLSSIRVAASRAVHIMDAHPVL